MHEGSSERASRRPAEDVSAGLPNRNPESGLPGTAGHACGRSEKGHALSLHSQIPSFVSFHYLGNGDNARLDFVCCSYTFYLA